VYINRKRLILDLLNEHPDGLSLREIRELMFERHEYLGDKADIRRSVEALPTVYIDRWTEYRNQPTPVYVAVVIPEDTPRPDYKRRR